MHGSPAYLSSDSGKSQPAYLLGLCMLPVPSSAEICVAEFIYATWFAVTTPTLLLLSAGFKISVLVVYLPWRLMELAGGGCSFPINPALLFDPFNKEEMKNKFLIPQKPG